MEPDHAHPEKRVAGELFAWWIALCIGLFSTLHWGQQSSHSVVGSGALLIAVLYAMRGAFLVGNSFRKRLRFDVHGKWTLLIPFTFYAYGAMQPAAFFDPPSRFRITAFLFAMALKLINAVGVSFMTLLDVVRRQRQCEMSVLFTLTTARRPAEQTPRASSSVPGGHAVLCFPW